MAGWTNLSGWTSLTATGLNSLAAGQTWVSGTITPPTSPPRPFYFDLRVILGSFSPTVLALPVYRLLQVEDATPLFADVTTGAFLTNLVLTSGASQKLSFLERNPCPLVPFRLAIQNPSGNAALAASGHAIAYQTYGEG